MEKYYPKIKFLVNKNFELKWLHSIRNVSRAVNSDLQFLFQKQFDKNRSDIFREYVNWFYTTNQKTISADIAAIKRRWQQKENNFFKQVDRIFNNHPWPKGNYRAYASIWRSFPRYIKEKKFTFPCKVSERYTIDFPMKVIAHELLHFITYDYLEKRYRITQDKTPYRDNLVWQFTESLNVLIENEKYWHAIIGDKEAGVPYKECEVLYKKMKKIWSRNKNIDNLIKKVFPI